MNRFMRLICTLASLLGIAGCDVVNMQEIKPGVTTGYEVRDRMGAPNTEWRNADGTVTWEYSRQPEGVECFMITIGSDNVVKAVEQVITPANMARIQPGGPRSRYVACSASSARSRRSGSRTRRCGTGRSPPSRIWRATSTFISTSTGSCSAPARATRWGREEGPGGVILELPQSSGERVAYRRLGDMPGVELFRPTCPVTPSVRIPTTRSRSVWW